MQLPSLPTPINVSELNRLLEGYEENKRSLLVNGFTHGFRLGCQPFNVSQASKNAASLQANVPAAEVMI